MKCQYGHDVPPHLQFDYPDALVETCSSCGERVIFNKAKDGTIDNHKYYLFHLKDFAQPTGKTAGIFNKFYGKPKDTKAAEDAMYERREEERMENWYRGMKAKGEEDWAKKMKNIVKKDK